METKLNYILLTIGLLGFSISYSHAQFVNIKIEIPASVSFSENDEVMALDTQMQNADGSLIQVRWIAIRSNENIQLLLELPALDGSRAGYFLPQSQSDFSAAQLLHHGRNELQMDASLPLLSKKNQKDWVIKSWLGIPITQQNLIKIIYP